MLLDLRCHGASSKLHALKPPHTLEAASEDIEHFIHSQLKWVVGAQLDGMCCMLSHAFSSLAAGGILLEACAAPLLACAPAEQPLAC